MSNTWNDSPWEEGGGGREKARRKGREAGRKGGSSLMKLKSPWPQTFPRHIPWNSHCYQFDVNPSKLFFFSTFAYKYEITENIYAFLNKYYILFILKCTPLTCYIIDVVACLHYSTIPLCLDTPLLIKPKEFLSLSDNGSENNFAEASWCSFLWRLLRSISVAQKVMCILFIYFFLESYVLFGGNF